MVAARPFVVGALVLLSLAASPAGAQDRSGLEDGETRRLFEAGRQAYAEERYEEALELFERAYVRAPLPELLFNVGLLHQRLGHDRAALEAFQEYLQLAEEGAERGEVERRIRVLQLRLSESQAPPAEAEAAEPTAPEPTDVATPAVPARAQPEIAWPLLAGGAALVVGGAVAVGFGASERAAVEGSSGGALQWTEAVDRLAVADALVVAGAIGLGVGAALGLAAIPFFQGESVTVSLRGPGLEIGGAF